MAVGAPLSAGQHCIDERIGNEPLLFIHSEKKNYFISDAWARHDRLFYNGRIRAQTGVQFLQVGIYAVTSIILVY